MLPASGKRTLFIIYVIYPFFVMGEQHALDMFMLQAFDICVFYLVYGAHVIIITV